MRCSEPPVFAGSQVPPAMPPAAHTSSRRGSGGLPVPAVSARKVPDLETAAAGSHCQDSAAVDTRQAAQVVWTKEQVLSIHLAGTRVLVFDQDPRYFEELRQLLRSNCLGMVCEMSLEAAEGWLHGCLQVQLVDLVVAPKHRWN